MPMPQSINQTGSIHSLLEPMTAEPPFWFGPLREGLLIKNLGADSLVSVVSRENSTFQSSYAKKKKKHLPIYGTITESIFIKVA